MSGRGYAEKNLPSFSANIFGPLDHSKIDCKAEELVQGLHLVSLMKDTGLEKDSPASSIPIVCYEPPTSSTSEVELLSDQIIFHDVWFPKCCVFLRPSVEANLSLKGPSLDPKLPDASIQPMRKFWKTRIHDFALINKIKRKVII